MVTFSEVGLFTNFVSMDDVVFAAGDEDDILFDGCNKKKIEFKLEMVRNAFEFFLTLTFGQKNMVYHLFHYLLIDVMA